jgi:hypothetical protein
MGIDLDKVRQRRDEARSDSDRGGKLWKLDEGDYKVYLHGLVHSEDDFAFTAGLNFLQVVMHYGVGKGGVVCLDPERNPVILHPLIRDHVKGRKNLDITPRTRCPICEAFATSKEKLSEEMVEAVAGIGEKHRRTKRWLLGMTPMYHRAPRLRDWKRLPFEPKVYLSGTTVFDGVCSEMDDSGDIDLTALDPVVLLQVSRTGKDFSNTDYKVSIDKDTLRKPTKFDEAQRAAIEDAVRVGGHCDLFRVIANWIKTPDQMEAALLGIDAEEEEATEFPPRDRRRQTQQEPRETRRNNTSERERPAPALAQAPTQERRKCWGVGLEAPRNKICRTCKDGDSCFEEIDLRSKSAEKERATTSASKSQGDEARPECYGDFLEDDDACGKCDLAKVCRVETRGAKAEDIVAEPEAVEDAPAEPVGSEDTELDAIQAEVDRIAKQKRK